MKVFLMSLILSFSAMATEVEVNLINQALDEDQCVSIGLTDDQMQAIKNQFVTLIHKKIDLYAKIKHAKLFYLQEVLKKEATYDSAMAKASDIGKAKEEKVMAKMDTFSKLILTVLTFEQRKYGILCLQGIQKKIDGYLDSVFGEQN